MIQALKVHVPEVEQIIERAGGVLVLSEPEQALPDLSAVDILCKEGVSLPFYQRVRSWLDADQERRLFWIEAQPARLAQLAQDPNALPLLNDQRTRIFFVETPEQKDFAIKKMGWMSAFKKILVISDAYRQEIERVCQAASLIASDAADFGIGLMRHAQANVRPPMRSFAALHGSMKGVPAIILGAGPSLEESAPALKAVQSHALLIVAGTAINKSPVRPHLAVAIDQYVPVQRDRYPDVPLCLQARAHPKSKKNVKGPLLYLPDSHYAFEPWLTGEVPFDGGWTVGNTAVQLAVQLGCDPIILVGMDFCYRGKQKYAGGKSLSDTSALVRGIDASGQAVWTQPDWLLAIAWMEQVARAHPDRSFINATVGGMRIGAPFSSASLVDAIAQTPPISNQWQALLQTAPVVELQPDRLQEWKQSLLRCKSEESESMQEREFTGEIAAELLLEPLWRIWAPLFERELMTCAFPIPMEEKLKLQKRLFFNQIIQEHLHVL